MPYVANMEEEQKTDPNLAPQGAVSPTGGGAGTLNLSPSAAVPSAGGSAAGASGKPPASAGGSFGSLQSYLTANQGQAQPLANTLTSGINQQYQNLDVANNAAIADINKQVTNAPGYTPSNPSLMSAEAANPASFAANPNNVQQFQSLLNNTYSGPVSAESTSDFSNQQNAINTAIAQGRTQTGTEAGREQALAKNEATPTAGVTALNSAILSQDPNAVASVQNAYAPFQNLLTNLNTGAANTDQTISKEQADAASSAQAANQQIANQINALNTGVSGELSTAQQNAAAQNAAVNAALKNLYGGAAQDMTATTLGTYGGGSTPWVNTTNYTVNPFSAEANAALGLSPDQAATLQNALQQAATSQKMIGHNFGAGSGTSQIDLSQFLTQQNPNAVINAANVATPQDYANAQAFQTLLQGMSTQAPATIISPSTASEAGTAPTSTNQFDYQTALNTAQQTAAAERAAAQQEATAISNAADLAHAQSQHTGGFWGGLKGDLGNIGQLLLSANPVTLPIAIATHNLPNLGQLAKSPISDPFGNIAKATITGAQGKNPNIVAAHGGIIASKKEPYEPFKDLMTKISAGAK